MNQTILDNIKTNNIIIINFQRKLTDQTDRVYVYADVESECYGEQHYPIITSYIPALETFANVRQFIDGKCVKRMFDNLVAEVSYKKIKQIRVGFHNLKYDWAVISPCIPLVTSVVKKDGQLYMVYLHWKKKKIVLTDTYKMITAPLRDFQKMFSLSHDKCEAIPFKFYTRYNILNLGCMIPKEEFMRGFEVESDKELFHSICEEEESEGNQMHKQAHMLMQLHTMLTTINGILLP